MRAKMLTALVASGLVGFLAAPAAQDLGAMPGSQAAPQPPPRKLELTFHGDGTVTLVAQSVQLREILTEWSRRGGSRIEGAERLPAAGAPPALKYSARPESEVLESLLRSAAGLILMPRIAGSAGPSRLDVHVLATSTGTQMYGGQPSTTTNTNPFPTQGSPNDEVPPVAQIPGSQPPPQPQAPPASTGTSRAPGVVPIQIVPVTPTTPGQTATPPGRGGGGGGGGGIW
jgi:hypothetical protein